MPTKRTVTTVTEYEYSEDGYVLKETKTQTTMEEDSPVAPWRQGPHTYFPPVGGGIVHYQNPKNPLVWNDHLGWRVGNSSGIPGAVDC